MKHPFMENVFYDTVTVGERGQVVIPAKARKDFGIKAGDKMMVLRGMGKMGVVLIHSKHMTKMFAKLSEHITKFKEMLSK